VHTYLVSRPAAGTHKSAIHVCCCIVKAFGSMYMTAKVSVNFKLVHSLRYHFLISFTYIILNYITDNFIA